MPFYHIAPLGIKSPILTYHHANALKKGVLVRIEVRRKSHYGVICGEVGKPDFECKDILEVCGIFGDKQRLLADFIAKYYRASLQESYNLFTSFKIRYQNAIFAPNFAESKIIAESKNRAESAESKTQAESATPTESTAPNNTLAHFRFYSEPIAPLSQSEIISIESRLNALNTEQQKANAFIESKNITLLFGDTGSGKSEIYFHQIARALARNQTALLLMPEIALTPQMHARLKGVFGECVEVWHSKLTSAQKAKIVQNLHQNRIKIIAGARSALFLPLANLGIIIVDEEHDDAYKSMSSPRYNARDLAMYLATKCHIKLILGSATPSLTSYTQAREKGYLYRLRGTHFGASKNFTLESSIGALTPKLLESIARTIDSSKQAIIFLPTRANFKSLICMNCGYGFVCPFCSVNMSVHVKRRALCCHYCGYTQALPSICPECQSDSLSSNRLGTQQLASELAAALPHANIGIFDKDHASTHKKLKQILHDFNTQKTQILIGTQMLSKGHDYHNVALAVIMGIDYVLNSGDYRSFERGVVLVHQIAGRAGRKDAGAVFIQSLQAEWLEAFLGDYEAFLRYELDSRSHNYPPFARLAMLHFSHKSNERAKAQMLEILPKLQARLAQEPQAKIIGYGANAIEKIAGKYRYHILICAPKATQILRALETLGDIDVDIDALDTL
ncbi:hypothetical protein BKN38_03025 [Helicobacter sp. CLO-3]|uniref:replication restart helicase PriA n=1 Tax=unclassified Helicobacter TaxID=2593540 RepID=UPI000805CB1E|nr:MULTISPECIES: primosomal protein N' [unclassified Helicobacter]OBV30083.1 hypothetical protein BA723_02615 [Helicobacter sp. CLO-3]OHU84440.1 hypothetical protein BKN38_03025 [Helicobacter sp. CLO-3]